MQIVVDTDPGVDDTLALFYLRARDDVSISAVTTVFGNCYLEEVLRTANYVCEFANIEAPILRGAEAPLYSHRGFEPAESQMPIPEEAASPTADGDAVDVLVEEAGDDTHLLALGPLTNVALALERDSEVLERYASVTIMGGAIPSRDSGHGNHTLGRGEHFELAEFNFICDPDAVRRVLRSRGQKQLVPVNACRDVTLSYERADALVSRWNDEYLIKLLEKYFDHYEEKAGEAPIYDGLTAGIAVDPGIGDSEPMELLVEPDGQYTTGMVLANENQEAETEPNAEVYLGADSTFEDTFLKAVKAIGPDN
jgi:purine nucleosidase